MSRPIAADGTCRYSTGRPGRENAPAVAEPPTAPIRPESRAAPRAPTTSRRGMRATAPRNLSTSVILASSSFLRPFGALLRSGASPKLVGLHTLNPTARLLRGPPGPHRPRAQRSSARVVNHTIGHPLSSNRSGKPACAGFSHRFSVRTRPRRGAFWHVPTGGGALVGA